MGFKHHSNTEVIKKCCTYSSLSHLVRGHSHIPLISDLLSSLAMNSEGVNPARSSHSGVCPASGAVRSGTSASTADWRRIAKDACLPGANADAVERIAAAKKSFILKVSRYGAAEGQLCFGKNKNVVDLVNIY